MHEICVEFPWWCMTIFNVVDGFSQLPVSLDCVSNNKPETLLSYFIKGVQTYGIPSRVRSDKGKNVLIRNFIDCKSRTRVWKLDMWQKFSQSTYRKAVERCT